jgi:two-component system chemotaxis response regulator CheY
MNIPGRPSGGNELTRTVLIADDSQFMRFVLKKILENNGFKVVADVENGMKAVEQYKATKPDLVTMDVVMPGMDGIEATRAIMEADSNAKVVVVSALGQQPLVNEAMEAGAKDFIVKPFEETKVVEVIKKLFNE